MVISLHRLIVATTRNKSSLFDVVKSEKQADEDRTRASEIDQFGKRGMLQHIRNGDGDVCLFSASWA